MKRWEIAFLSALSAILVFISCLTTASASNVKINYMTASSTSQSNGAPGGGLGKSEISVKNIKCQYLNVTYNSKTGEKLNIYLPKVQLAATLQHKCRL